MKKILIISVLLLLFNCEKENKYGVIGSIITYPHFPQEQVEKTIIKAIGCDYCIKEIEYPTGYPIATPRVLFYRVTYINEDGYYLIKEFYIGKVLTEKEQNNSKFLRLEE